MLPPSDRRSGDADHNKCTRCINGRVQGLYHAAVAEQRSRRPLAGRPEATSHAEIEQAAFRLFGVRGFDGTTLNDIAAAVGVSRRTLFRYFRSKNDIPWGQFDR